MKTVNFCKGLAMGLACMGAVVPQQVFAAGPVVGQVASQNQIADVALTNGTLAGKVVNANGELLSGSVVKVSMGNKEVATVVTSQSGEFAVNNLSSGIYQVSTGTNQASVRVWEGQFAPPAAKDDVLLVNEGTLNARGQSCWRNPKTLIIGGTLIAAAIAIPVALHNSGSDGGGTPVSP